MSAAEYRDWCDYYVLEPWGCEVEDHRVGTIASILIRANGGKALSPLDIFPRSPNVEEKVLAKVDDGKVLSEKLIVAFRKIDANQRARQKTASS